MRSSPEITQESTAIVSVRRMTDWLGVVTQRLIDELSWVDDAIALMEMMTERLLIVLLQFPEQSVTGIPGIYPNTVGILYPQNNDYC